MTGSHYHYGFGLAGYGPEEPETCRTLECLRHDVHAALDDVAQEWLDQFHGERSHIEQLRKERPANGSDPVGYPGSWESIATAALRALECLDQAEEVDTLRQGLRDERRDAPLYREDPAAWTAEVSRLLLDSGTYPLETTIDGGARFYVWSCDSWEHLLSEHDERYVALPLACRTDGGQVPCACRDCMESLSWSPMWGTAPYCHACVDGDCADRQRGECSADHGD